MSDQKVLVCKCGACAHWEIIEKSGQPYIFCMTCKKEFPVKFEVHDVGQHKHAKHRLAEHLEWIQLDSNRKKWLEQKA